VSRSVEFHPDAQEDLYGAMDWYNRESAGLGTAFVAAVERTIQMVAVSPMLGSLVGTELRRVLVPTFPYAVLYAVEEQRLWIVAVAHFRRRPTYWRDRR
jgi:plasmid stabilization system protein ParE